MIAIIPFSTAVETGTTAVNTLPDAVETVTTAVDALSDSVDTVSDAVESASDAVESVTTAVDTLSDAVETVTIAVESVADAVETVADAHERRAIIAELADFPSFSTTAAKGSMDATGVTGLGKRPACFRRCIFYGASPRRNRIPRTMQQAGKANA